jgi:hypothetical protein
MAGEKVPVGTGTSEGTIEDTLRDVLASLKQHGLLLQTDAQLPNVCALVAGGPVRGSWWAHPRSHDIFRANCALADHPDVLITKLVSAKITYVDRTLWPAVIAAGRARESWQMDRLTREARKLLDRVDCAPVETDRTSANPASELERAILVYSEQFHSDRGAHLKRLESWDQWSRRTGFGMEPVSAVQARHKLEERLRALNQHFRARGRLPWQG